MLDQRLHLLVVEQITLPGACNRIIKGEVTAVILQNRRSFHPLTIFPVTHHLGYFADIDFRIKIGSESFSMISTFGTPLDVTQQEIRIETFLPANEKTEQFLRDLS